MKYISLYTLPADKNSLNIIDDFGYYFFDESQNNKFDLKALNKALYLGFGKEYQFGDNQEYLKIQKIGKTEISTGKFEIDFKNSEFNIITKEFIGILNELNSAFNIHIEEFHKDNNGKIRQNTPKKWIFYKVKEIIELNEDVLYKSKTFISFPINIDKDGNYIEAMKFVNSLKLDEDLFLNIKENYIIFKGELTETTKINCKILELIFTSSTNSFNIHNYEKELKEIKPNILFDYDSLRTNTLKALNSFIKKYSKIDVKCASKSGIIHLG